MNEILSAIEEHLQRRLSVSQLDYYQVIGLEPFCSDKSQIQSALEKAWETIRRSEDSNIANKDDKTQSLQLVNKLLKQAQTILLDATKKTAYDSQLAKLFESQKKQKSLGKETANTTAAIGILAKTTAKSAATDSAQTAKPNEAELLPTGDPMQPYIASVALPSTLSNYSVDKRRAELTELFPSLMHMSFQPEPTQEQAPAWLVAADRKPASSEPVPKSIDLVEQLRKSRRQRNLLAIGGMILAAVGLLGFASYRFLSNRMQLAQQQEKKNTQGNIAQAPTTGEKQTGTKTPELVIAPNKRNGKQTSQQPLPELPSVRKDPDPSATPPADPAMNEAVNPAPAQTAPSPDVPTPNAPTPTPEPKPEPAPEPKPEPAMTSESDQWKKGMTQARELLALGDLKKFDSMMAGLLDKAVTKEGKDQTARLDQAGQLYKIYVESFEEAKRKAKGASALKVGNTEVSIVETTPEKIIIRQGENKSYAWDKLPFGIAAALSDLGLSESAPVDVAARAIYFSVTPFYQEAAKANNLITKRIDGWFERSAGKESIRADLKQFLTDKYE